MPRRRNNNNAILVLDELNIEPKEPIRIVKPFLKNNYFDMLKKNGERIECSICMDEIDCKNCFCLLTCGHYFHLYETLRCDSCPVCRN
jgi:hypothetical protein